MINLIEDEQFQLSIEQARKEAVVSCEQTETSESDVTTNDRHRHSFSFPLHQFFASLVASSTEREIDITIISDNPRSPARGTKYPLAVSSACSRSESQAPDTDDDDGPTSSFSRHGRGRRSRGHSKGYTDKILSIEHSVTNQAILPSNNDIPQKIVGRPENSQNDGSLVPTKYYKGSRRRESLSTPHPQKGSSQSPHEKGKLQSDRNSVRVLSMCLADLDKMEESQSST